MSSVVRRSIILACLCVFVASWTPALVPEDPERVRARLMELFADPAAASPTVLGALASDPDTLAAVQARILGMSDEELNRLGEAMGDMPAWAAASELVAGALPPGTRAAVIEQGRVLAGEAAQGLELRRRAGALAALGRMAPGSIREGAGFDPDAWVAAVEGLGSLEGTGLGAVSAAVGGPAAWQESSSGVLEALPSDLKAGLLEMGEVYPFDTATTQELESFRSTLLRVLDGVLELPGELPDGVDPEAVASTANRVRSATLEELFLLRRTVDRGRLEALAGAVDFGLRAASLTPSELDRLERVREELLAELDGIGDAGGAGALRDTVMALDPAGLLLLDGTLLGPGITAPARTAVLSAMADPVVLDEVRVAAVDPAALERLERFRAAELEWLESIRQEDDPTVEAAIFAVREFTVPQLALLESSAGRLPEGSTGEDFVALPQVITAVAGCPDGFGWVCDLIDDATDWIGDSIDDLWGSIGSLWTSVNDLVTGLTTLGTQIGRLWAEVGGLLGNIQGFFANTWDMIAQLPQTIWETLKGFWDQLVQSSIGQLLSDPAALVDALGLAGDFYNSIPNLPMPPCPPAGTLIAGFGAVGDGDTATRFSRYKFFADQLLGLIPDTEVSLKVKIPAKLTYGAVEYLGTCLEAAAAGAESAATESDRQTVTAGLTTTAGNQAALMSQLMGVQAQVLSARDLNVRLQIERNLKAPFDDAVAIFQMPASVGGYLDAAMDVVWDAILRAESAGENVGRARDYMRQATKDYENGSYKLAYRSLQRAYRQVIWAGPAER